MNVDPAPRRLPTLARLAANTASQAVGIVGAAAIGFVTFIVAVRGLGPAGYGDFTAATVYLFLPVVVGDVGLSTSMLREISRRPERAAFVMQRSLPLRLIVSLAILVTAIAVALVLPFEARARTAIYIGSVGSLFALLNSSLLPILQAQLRMHVAVGANLAGRLLTFGLTATAFELGLGISSYMGAAVIGLGLTFAVDLTIVRRLVPLRPVIDLPYWRWLMRDSLAIGGANALFQSYFRIDTILLALIRSAREVGLYGAAYKFIEIGELFVSTIGITIFPTFTELAANRDPRLSSVIRRSLDLVIASTCPLVVAVLVVPSELVTLTAGAEFGAAAPALQLLAIYLFLVGITGIIWRLLSALHADRFLLLLATVVLLVNVALNLILLPIYGYKVAALTSAGSELVVLAAAFWGIRQRLGYLPNFGYLIVVVPAAAAMGGTIALVPGHVLVRCAIGGLVYVAAVVLLPGTVRDVVRGLTVGKGAAPGIVEP